MCDAMKKKISETKCFLIDGYPRELEQGTKFEKEVTIPVLLWWLFASIACHWVKLFLVSKSIAH
jgi:hypothetical protein